MLVIREAQIEAIGEGIRDRIERELVRHLTTLYPRETAEAGGEGQIAELVSRTSRRAAREGFAGSSKDLGLYVALTFILGVDFEADPQIPWAGRQLKDSSLPHSIRIESAYDAALEYLEATAGEACEHLVRAMLRIRDYDLARVPASEGEQWADDFAGVLRALYPRKFDYQGETANRNLIALGMKNADRNGFHGPQSRAIWITLMFMLGSGFDHDLLYPWVREALAADGEEERAALLYAGAMRHLEASLAPDLVMSAS